MPGYRFCRTDDIPRLVDAYNLCWRAHAQNDPPLTVDGFKRLVREQNLWASSSMLAFSGEQTIGILLGAKRDDANLVHRIAILPGHERRGHGRHLLESLCSKVAILGPPRLFAEVPAASAGACRFFERCGFRARQRYVDLVWTAAASPSAAEADMVSPITLAELRDAGALAAEQHPEDRPWQRSPQTLANLGDAVEGLAIATDLRIEAYVLHRRGEGGAQILAVGGPQPGLLHLLVTRLYELGGGPPMISKATEHEISRNALESLGFRARAEHVSYEAAANPV